ncbi:MAG: hypothetical protein P8M25_20750 [Paracoccaceae bacterium]|nr:hypothetical protein [Paracoccaceae bacterium]
MTSDPLCPDSKIISDFIHEITRDWHDDLDQNGLFELRCLAENRSSVTKGFALHALEDAIDLAVRMNRMKLNVYMTINPVSDKSVGKAAVDTDILRAHYSFADADDQAGLNGLEVICAKLEPDLIVTTGTNPHVRRHVYWRLLDPCMNLSLWSSWQIEIAKRCQTDSAVINPSRVMRVAGSVSYPNQAKQAKGYVPELVTLSVRPS